MVVLGAHPSGYGVVGGVGSVRLVWHWSIASEKRPEPVNVLWVAAFGCADKETQTEGRLNGVGRRPSMSVIPSS